MTETNLVATVILVKIIALSLALVITHSAYATHQRSKQTEFRALFLGFGGISAGILLGGGICQILGYDILVGVLVEGVFMSIGLGLVVYSLIGFEENLPNSAENDSSSG